MGTPTHYVELHLATLNSSLPASPHPWPLSAPYFPVSFCMFSLQIPHLDLPALPPGPPAALPAQGAGLSPGPGGDTRSPGAAFKSHAPTVSLPFLLSLGDTQAWLSPPPQAGLGSLLLVQEAWVPVPCAHLAELYLHEHVMLPPTAALRAPRVLGPVVARTAGWGAPVARQASSCPRKKRWGDPSSQWTPFLASDQQLRACKARHLFPAQPLPPILSCPLHPLVTCGRDGGRSPGLHRGARPGRARAAPHDCWARGSGQVLAAGPCCPAAVRSAHPGRQWGPDAAVSPQAPHLEAARDQGKRRRRL